MNSRKGFTMVELMVSVTILGVVMAAVVVLLINSQNAKRQAELMADAQIHAQAALEIVARELKTAGYGANLEAGQSPIAFAAPFECIFNANINPFPNDTLPYGEPRAYDPGSNPVCPNYNPGVKFNSGAETYRYFFSATDSLALRTFNPNDAVLIRQVYGEMNSGSNQAMPALDQHLAVLSPQQGTDIVPLFQYWYRTTPAATALTLWGDTDNDGQLTGAERNFAAAPASVRASIEEITLTVTAETRMPLRNQYRRVSISTRINLFNVPVASVKYFIRGHCYQNGTTSGIVDGEVRLSNGSMQVTATDGLFEFAVDPGTYVVRPPKLIEGTGYYYMLLNPQDSIVTLSSADADNIDFRYQVIAASDMGQILGVVYNDTIAHVGLPAEPQVGERMIAGVKVTVSGKSIYSDTTALSFTAQTDINGGYSFTLPQGWYTVTELDSVGYFSSTPNSVVDTLSPAEDKDTLNFGDYRGAAGIIKVKVWKDNDKDSLDDGGAAEPGLANVLCVVTKGGYEDIEVARGRTDANGEVSFFVPADSVYSVYELDPDSMTSTSALSLGYNHNPSDSVVSPYLNRVENISVPEGDTFRIKFGDAVGFITISLGQTERVLSLTVPYLNEYRNPPGSISNPTSTTNDVDIVLGTVKASTANMLCWYNLYVNSSTSFGSIFTSSPHNQYDVGYDVPAMASAILDTGVVTDDVVAGLRGNSGGHNIIVALTHKGGTASGTGSPASRDNRDKGLLAWDASASPSTPPYKPPLQYYSTISGANTDVLTLATGLLTPSNKYDFAVGAKTGENTGHLEIWRNNGTGSLFTRVAAITIAAGVSLGEVRAICVDDVVDSLGLAGKDGLQDLIVGTKTGSHPNYRGQLIIFRRIGKNLLFDHHLTIEYTDGYVNSIKAYDSGLPRGTQLKDIAVGLRTIGATEDDYLGRIELWHNKNNGSFGNFGQPNDLAQPGGEVLSLDAGRLDIDNYDDLVAGIKTAENTGGTLMYESSRTTRGYLPTDGRDPSGGEEMGEAVVVRTTVFRPSPGRTDIIVAVREVNALSQNVGKLVIYFNKF
jgi:prepilin-type N-terminal cleavage/methylation domain-containing protein